MIPTFTIVTTLVTIGVTALLIGILVRINNPRRHEQRDQIGNGRGAVLADGGRSGGRKDNDSADGDSGADGGGDGGGGD